MKNGYKIGGIFLLQIKENNVKKGLIKTLTKSLFTFAS